MKLSNSNGIKNMAIKAKECYYYRSVAIEASRLLNRFGDLGNGFCFFLVLHISCRSGGNILHTADKFQVACFTCCEPWLLLVYLRQFDNRFFNPCRNVFCKLDIKPIDVQKRKEQKGCILYSYTSYSPSSFGL